MYLWPRYEVGLSVFAVLGLQNYCQVKDKTFIHHCGFGFVKEQPSTLKAYLILWISKSCNLYTYIIVLWWPEACDAHQKQRATLRWAFKWTVIFVQQIQEITLYS